jgi:hypothetical protein
MEPRRDDGDDVQRAVIQLVRSLSRPQWSPVVTTGTTSERPNPSGDRQAPQWSPVVTTGTTGGTEVRRPPAATPQWSPVVTTGTTARRIRAA